MRWFRVTLLLILFTLLAVRFPPALVERGLTPFWLLLPALLFGFVGTPGTAALGGWCCGAIVGLLSIEPFGVSAFLYAGAAYFVALARGSFFSEHPVTQGVAAFVLAVVVGFLELLRIEIDTPALGFWVHVPVLLLMAAITGALYPVLHAVEQRTGILKGFREGERRVRA